MHRYLWGQLRYRRTRAVALLVGILVATTAFTVLTGTTQTSRLQTIGTVARSFRPAYDILVRPRGSTTALERSQQLVRPNYLSGIFGGISLNQYAEVKRLAGVQVAAPIAMVGYVLQNRRFQVDLRPYLGSGPRQVFRVTVTRSTDRGLSRLVDVPSTYVYVTNRVLQPPTGYTVRPNTVTGPTETLESGRTVVVCPQLTIPTQTTGPFDPLQRDDTQCNSRNPASPGGFGPATGGAVSAQVSFPVPFLIAAVDPAAEARLAHLDTAVVRGRYLRSSDHPTVFGTGQGSTLTVPVLVASRGYVDDRDLVTIRRLSAEATQAMTAGLFPDPLTRRLAAQDGPIVANRTIDATNAYQQLTTQLVTGLREGGGGSLVESYWTVGPTRYARRGSRELAPLVVDNPVSVWQSSFQPTGFVNAPAEGADVAFRALSPHVGSNAGVGGMLALPAPHAVGLFDPTKLPGFSGLSAVPEETYTAPVATPADGRTGRLLGGQELLPNGNFAGYLQSPPLLLTTLASLPAFYNPSVFPNPNAAEPISVIRIRVAGVTGVDAVSRERIRLVAQQVVARTGLEVDITAGSSPTPMTIDLPAGRFGRPPLTLREGWVKKGVAVAILTAVDRKSLMLFVLILAVCALFVANTAAAAVRTRRTELGVLACIGWRPTKLFAAALLELGLVGLVAGVLGSLLALPLSAAFGLSVSVPRAALAVPAAVVLALLAGVAPAFRAARSTPGEAVRPAVLVSHRARQPRGVVGLAMLNLARVPGRSVVGAASLGIGVCALTLLLAVTLAFQGELVGSLLGGAISVQIRAVDYVAAAVMMALGALALGDVLYLNIRDRATELTTLRAIGWRERPLGRLVATEGIGMGVVGSVVGAALGLAGAAAFTGQLPLRLVLVAVAAVVVGTALTVLATVVPVAVLRRLPTAQTLAED